MTNKNNVNKYNNSHYYGQPQNTSSRINETSKVNTVCKCFREIRMFEHCVNIKINNSRGICDGIQYECVN